MFDKDLKKPPLVLKSWWGAVAELPNMEAVSTVHAATRDYMRDPQDRKLCRRVLLRADDMKRARFRIECKGLVIVGCAGHYGEVVWEWCGLPGPVFDERYGTGRGQGLGETKTYPEDFATWAQYYNARQQRGDAKPQHAGPTKIHMRRTGVGGGAPLRVTGSDSQIKNVKTFCGEDVEPGNSKPSRHGVTCEGCLTELENMDRAARRVRGQDDVGREIVAARNAQRAADAGPGFVYSTTSVDEEAEKPNAIALHVDKLREKAEMNERELLQKKINELETQLAEGSKQLEKVCAERKSDMVALTERGKLVEQLEREVVDLRKERDQLKNERFGLRTQIDELLSRRPSGTQQVQAQVVSPQPVNGSATSYRLEAENGYLKEILRQRDEEVVRLRVQIASTAPAFQYHYQPAAPQLGYGGPQGWPPQAPPPPASYQHPGYAPPPPPPAPPPPAPPPPAPPPEPVPQPVNRVADVVAEAEAAVARGIRESQAGQEEKKKRKSKGPPIVLDRGLLEREQEALSMLKKARGKWVGRFELARELGIKEISVVPLISNIRKIEKIEIESTKNADDGPGYSAYRLAR